MAKRSRSRRPPMHTHSSPRLRRVERFWGRLTDLFGAHESAPPTTTAVLAPRRLEPRRMLDAAAAGLAFELLDSNEFVQAGADFAEIGASQADAAAASANTPPSNIQINPPADVDEGGVATLELVFDDPDVGDSHTVEVDWGDGSPLETFTVSTGSQFFSTTHEYLDDNPTDTPFDFNSIQVRVIDAADEFATASAMIKVSNLDPSNLQISPVADIDEDGVAQLDLAFDEPGVEDTHTVEVDWGDGTPLEVFNVSPGSQFFSTTHQYLDDAPSVTTQDTYQISVRVVDDDGGDVAGMTSVLVKNVAPSNLQIAPPAAIDEDGVASLELTFEDPGTEDTHLVEVDWGDGTAVEFFNVTAGERFFATTHQYLDDDPSVTPADAYAIKVRLLDDDNGEISGETSVTVSNVAPSGVVIAPLVTIDENDFATLELTFEDPGTEDEHEVEINWGDGSAVEVLSVTAGARFFSTTHQYRDDDPSVTTSDVYTVSVRVLDDDSGASSPVAMANITVNNVAPSGVVIAPVATIDENDFATLELTFEDPGQDDTHSVEIDWGDGSTVETLTVTAGSRFFSTTHQYLDDNPTVTSSDVYTVSVRVLDDDSGASSPIETASVTVNNVAPSNVVVAPIATIDENDFATLELTFEDPGTEDEHEVEIDWGDGSTVEVLTVTAGSRFFSTTHQYLDDDPTVTSSDIYTVSVRVLDDDGGASSPVETANITVNNVAPSEVVISPLATIDENDVATLELTFDDPGTLDTHEVEIDWGDGSAVETLTVTAGSRFFSTTHQYLDDNPTVTSSDVYTVSVRVLDDDSGASPVESATITVNNVAPSGVVISPLAMIDENDFATLELTFEDPGTEDEHEVEIDWGDGSAVETLTVTAGSRFFSTTHQYLDDNPTVTTQDTYTVSVRVLDDDSGASPTETATVLVKNVAPFNVAVIPPANMLDEGGTVSLDFAFDDPGTLDTHTYQIDWGDGFFTTDAAVGHGFASSHTYADNGNYTVKVTVTDDDSGVGMGMGTVMVKNVPPMLTVVADQELNEGSLLSIVDIGTFTDPGFNNPLNTLDPANGAEVEETFTYTIDWGDGTMVDDGAATVDQLGGVGVLTTGSFDGSHTYADNGLYTVIVTVMDDDMGQHQLMFKVNVINVDPTLRGHVPSPSVLEGQAFTLTSLGVGLEDPGFDNPLNAGNAANGGETEETFTAVDVDWGDGTAVESLGTTNRVSGSPGVFTTADFTHAPHTYADNGTYTVTLRLSDDDGPVVTRTLQIVVQNVPPTLTLTGDSFSLNEGQTLTISNLGTFTDPGFDNPANAGNVANGGQVEETFTYTIDWGDGTVETLQLPATRVSGSPGVLTVGTLANSHFYADNDPDNKYTITVTLSDDDGGSHAQLIVVTVFNVNPTLQPVSATDVNAQGETTLQLSFADPGADSFEVLVDWGDKLSLPPSERFVVETVHAGPTPQSFTLVHMYEGPPDPANPAADITITVKIRDDDFGTPLVVQPGESNVEFDVITNPGEGNRFIRIDTSPKVPMLTLPDRPVNAVLLVTAEIDVESSEGGEISGSAGESKVTGERYLVLTIVNPDGTDGIGYPLAPEVLGNLAGLFRNLPDNHYKIYLMQAETEAKRLVIEVYVRNGRLIDPGDDSEGARDRPPTDESAAAPDAEPLDAAPPDVDENAGDDTTDDGAWIRPAGTSYAAWRHGSTLASVALALSAAGKSWRTQVDETLAKAQREQRRRLRTVGHWRRRPNKPR